jgi:hypothetical protein
MEVTVITIVELLLVLLVGIVMTVILTRALGRPEESRAAPAGVPAVKLSRSARTPEGREETRLLLNDKVVLTAANDGVRLAEYADDVEQLEAIAARLAGALGVGVEFERIGPRVTGPDQGIAVRDLPKVSQDEIEADERRRRLDRQQDTV